MSFQIKPKLIEHINGLVRMFTSILWNQNLRPLAIYIPIRMHTHSERKRHTHHSSILSIIYRYSKFYLGNGHLRQPFSLYAVHCVVHVHEHFALDCIALHIEIEYRMQPHYSTKVYAMIKPAIKYNLRHEIVNSVANP